MMIRPLKPIPRPVDTKPEKRARVGASLAARSLRIRRAKHVRNQTLD
jgi:hypothetical protein